MLLFFLKGLTLGFSAAVSPGPFQAFLLSLTLQNSWRRALPATLAPLISDGPIIVLLLLLLTQMPAGFLRLIQIGGGLFLLYLAWGAFQAYRRTAQTNPDMAPALAHNKRYLLKAVLVNGLSPGPYIFWGILAGPIFMEGWRESASWGISFMAGFYGALIGGFAILVFIFATGRRLGPAVSRTLSGVSALALLLFGLYQLWQGVRP